jgi:NAD-specific glutamate dehydrogenase
MVKLVQDFDKLCDQLRDYCDELSKLDFKKEAMQEAVDLFNDHYYDDLSYLGFSELICEDGKVNIEEISQLTSLVEAFFNIANRPSLGYKVKVEGNFAELVEK